MGREIGELVALAIGIAMSPVPIAGVFFLTLAPNGLRASIGFAVGWIGGLAIAVAVFAALSTLVHGLDSPAYDITAGVIPLVLGVLLVLAGVVQLRRRARSSEPAPMPRWIGMLERLTPARAVIVAASYSAFRPKSLALSIAAGVIIGRGPFGVVGSIVTAVIFATVASLPIVAPVVARAVGGPGIRRALEQMRDWLAAHMATITAIAMVVIGLALIAIGLFPS